MHFSCPGHPTGHGAVSCAPHLQFLEPDPDLAPNHGSTAPAAGRMTPRAPLHEAQADDVEVRPQPDALKDRFPVIYGGSQRGQLQPIGALDRPGAASRVLGGPSLSSTASDYARFAQMLVNSAELDGVRILSRKTVDLRGWVILIIARARRLRRFVPPDGTARQAGPDGSKGRNARDQQPTEPVCARAACLPRERARIELAGS